MLAFATVSAAANRTVVAEQPDPVVRQFVTNDWRPAGETGSCNLVQATRCSFLPTVGGATFGRKIVTVLPKPNLLSIVTCPPICRTNPKTWLSPRPLPAPT